MSAMNTMKNTIHPSISLTARATTPAGNIAMSAGPNQSPNVMPAFYPTPDLWSSGFSSGVTAPYVFSAADAALPNGAPPPINPGVGVLRIVRVTGGAMCLGRISCAGSCSAKQVDPTCHRLEVGRVDTTPDAAKVVGVDRVIHWSDKCDVRKPVSVDRVVAGWPVESGVATLVDGTGPDPATGIADGDLAPEPLRQSLVTERIVSHTNMVQE